MKAKKINYTQVATPHRKTDKPYMLVLSASEPKLYFQLEIDNLLQARQGVLEFITKYRIRGVSWTGGKVLDPFGNDLARISYNGRLWLPDPFRSDPYPPVVEYDKKLGILTLWYKYIFKQLDLSVAQPKNWHFYEADPIIIGAGIEVRMSCQHLEIRSVNFKRQDGWKPMEEKPLVSIELPEPITQQIQQAATSLK
jgi:hypothetical protein